MKKMKLLFFVFCFPFVINAQPSTLFPANGAQWSILIDDPNCNCFCTAIYRYEKDTFVCGYNYSMITIQNPSECSWWTPILFRTSGDSIFSRMGATCSSYENFMYNFNLHEGDTFSTYFLDTAEVINIEDVTMLNSQIRKKINLQSINGAFNYEWIEGIGDLTHFYYSQILSEPIMTVLCYQDSSGLVYKNQLWNTCDTTAVGISENNLFKYNFNIYPNPSSEIIKVEYSIPSAEQAKIVITDLMGKLIKVIQLQFTSGSIAIDANDLPEGILQCALQINGRIIYTKKIIIKSTK